MISSDSYIPFKQNKSLLFQPIEQPVGQTKNPNADEQIIMCLLYYYIKVFNIDC